MPNSTFIVIEKSYLIRKGITTLIEKIPNAQVTLQIDSKEELTSINGFDADFTIINSNFIDTHTVQILVKNLGKCQIILLTESERNQPNGISWAEIIDLDESQKSILKKLNQLIGTKVSNKPKSYTPDEISEREADILRNIALGYSNKEIADKLFISTHTVVTHRKNITRKLGIKTVPGLTIYAILNKLIDIEDQSKL